MDNVLYKAYVFDARIKDLAIKDILLPFKANDFPLNDPNRRAYEMIYAGASSTSLDDAFTCNDFIALASGHLSKSGSTATDIGADVESIAKAIWDTCQAEHPAVAVRLLGIDYFVEQARLSKVLTEAESEDDSLSFC